MKLQIAALVLLTAVSFATSGQTVRALTLTSTEAELQTAIASQDLLKLRFKLLN
ncbi:MAG: hypothetical protein HC833_21895 [Leptolyngbyaceae cyanobacterium RM1_406_9]|nr:hypothetical protein [Leptolyngbyaceae cyanobacterium RM1_406_9]